MQAAIHRRTVFFGGGGDGSLTWDAKGCLQDGGTGTNDAGVVVNFTKNCDVSVSAEGKVVFPHTQTGTFGSVAMIWRGWMAGSGEVVLLTRESGSPATFQPGTNLLVRKQTGHGKAKVSGSYFIAHLVYNPTAKTAFTVWGALDFDGAGAITGRTLSLASGAVFGVKGTSITVDANGGMALSVADSSGNSGFMSGQASPYGTGLSQGGVLHAAKSQDPNAPPFKGSFAVLLQRGFDPAKCGDKSCALPETMDNYCAGCGCPDPAKQVCDATTRICLAKAVCGDGKCNGAETPSSCCKDCGCPEGQFSSAGGKCEAVPPSCTSVTYNLLDTRQQMLFPMGPMCGYMISPVFPVMVVCDETGTSCTQLDGGYGMAYPATVPYPNGKLTRMVRCCWYDNTDCIPGASCKYGPNQQNGVCWCDNTFAVDMVGDECGIWDAPVCE